MAVSTDLMLKLLQDEKNLSKDQRGFTDANIGNDLETNEIKPSLLPKRSRGPIMADVLASCLALSASKDHTPLK
jgi:hypothetical protein